MAPVVQLEGSFMVSAFPVILSLAKKEEMCIYDSRGSRKPERSSHGGADVPSAGRAYLAKCSAKHSCLRGPKVQRLRTNAWI